VDTAVGKAADFCENRGDTDEKEFADEKRDTSKTAAVNLFILLYDTKDAIATQYSTVDSLRC
jgi:hypothetical protein